MILPTASFEDMIFPFSSYSFFNIVMPLILTFNGLSASEYTVSKISPAGVLYQTTFPEASYL